MTQTSELIDTRTGEMVPINNSIEQLPSAASPLDMPVEIFAAALQRRQQNRSALMVWIREALIDGTDYGRIHNVGKNRCQLAAQGRAKECTDLAHWSKPSLMKPGAEKICGMLGVSPKYPTLNDYERSAVEGRALDQIVLRCEIEDAGGRIVAHGIGARSLSQDYGDLNKTLKMAAKSAHIDAVLRLAGLSELFTQDIEDMKKLDVNENCDSVTDNQQRQAQNDPANLQISEGQHKRIEARISGLSLDRERVKAWTMKKWGVESFTDLNQMQAHQLDKKLNEFRRQCDAEPISDDERIALDGFCCEHGIKIIEILPDGINSIGELTHGQALEMWDAAKKIIAEKRAKQLAQPQVLTEEQRKALAMAERHYNEAEAKRGRSSTLGT